jgi:hypothetical protein
MTQIFKATISFGDKTIVFEGPREFVEEQVARYTNAKSTSSHQDKDTTDTENSSLPLGGVPERHLVLQKKPGNHPETVAVLAFCLAEQGSTEFTEDDIRRAYLRAVLRPPKVIAQAIRDAKNNFDFIESGSQRGTYRLTPHGDRTVRFDLPHRTA